MEILEQIALLGAATEAEPAGTLHEDRRVDIDPAILADNWGDMSQNPELLLLAEEAAEHYQPQPETALTTEKEEIMTTTTTTTTATASKLFDMDLAEMRALLQQDETRLVQLTPEQIGQALLLEAVKYLAQQPADPAKDYQVFNVAVCKVWRQDVGALQRLAVTALRNVNAARQAGEDEAITAAQRQVELLAMLVRQVAGSVTRGGFYKHREATKIAERNAANGAAHMPTDYNADDGRRAYHAPILAEFTPEDVLTATAEVTGFMEQVFNVLAPAASRWFQVNAAVWSLGRDTLADGSFVDLPNIAAVWQMLSRKADSKTLPTGKAAAASLLQAFGAPKAEPLLKAAEPEEPTKRTRRTK